LANSETATEDPKEEVICISIVNQKCRKPIILAPKAEKIDLGILRRKWAPSKMGMSGPSPDTKRILRDQD
jgi:hypothetical protein